MVVVAVRIGRLLTDVPEGFHVGLFLRQNPTGRLDAWIKLTSGLAMTSDQILDVLEEAIDKCRDEIHVRSTIEEMEKRL